jgi:hypothetical protein
MVDSADDAPDAPLIRNHRTSGEELDDEVYEATHDVDLSNVSLLLEKNLKHPGIFVWALTVAAGISGLLFGCTYSRVAFNGSRIENDCMRGNHDIGAVVLIVLQMTQE